MCKLLDLFRKPTEPVIDTSPDILTPEGTVWVDYGWLKNKLVEAGIPREVIFLSDRDQYLLPTENDIALFLAQNDVNHEIYETEVFDCDNFALALAGDFSHKPWSAVTFGLIWTSGHAFNLFVTEREVLYIEPQTDEITELREKLSTGAVRFVMI